MNFEWIPAADARPEHHGKVLVTRRVDGGYKVEIASYSKIFGFAGDIVAWAKMPDPYVASKAEDEPDE